VEKAAHIEQAGGVLALIFDQSEDNFFVNALMIADFSENEPVVTIPVLNIAGTDGYVRM
jgi:hypothetical protein